ncbi:MAG: epoxide hydrolase [Gammaproteobacteria bacterium]|jgi:epoxide hydrolase|nr:epoxide hydrolase [Gammaproteobacteria bacterium]MBT7369571.1 epoxide hydrolase [Gammaproteobacteria bacterium]
MTAIRPYKLNIPTSEIDDLKTRLKSARWPEAETVEDWSQGVPIKYHREFCDYWANDYNWYKTQDRLNRFGQYKTTIDDLDIHFLHVKSSHENATPIIITHGWPGSIMEFHKILGPLAEPTQHGDAAENAFHIVCPSLPGYGFSSKPQKTGWGVEKIAETWDKLMNRLGYDDYLAQGGDWGSAVTTAIGLQNKGRCKGIHVNMPNATAPAEARENPNEADKKAMSDGLFYQQWDSGYSKQQSTRPQTLGYGLADSPIGQSAWILEKFYQWTDCDGHPENVLSRDELIDNIMFYWLTNSGASSARLYWESFASFSTGDNTVELPTGVSSFPKEVVRTPRTWAEKRYTNIQYWHDMEKGGHFAAFEQPELFIKEMRNWLKTFD